eukprot:GSA25T00022426001.1
MINLSASRSVCPPVTSSTSEDEEDGIYYRNEAIKLVVEGGRQTASSSSTCSSSAPSSSSEVEPIIPPGQEPHHPTSTTTNRFFFFSGASQIQHDEQLALRTIRKSAVLEDQHTMSEHVKQINHTSSSGLPLHFQEEHQHHLQEYISNSNKSHHLLPSGASPSGDEYKCKNLNAINHAAVEETRQGTTTRGGHKRKQASGEAVIDVVPVRSMSVSSSTSRISHDVRASAAMR